MTRTFLILFFIAFAASAGGKSTVVVVRDENAVRGFEADEEKVRAMVSAGIRALTGKMNDAAAWSSLFNSNDVVGIKINTQAAPLHGTRPEVVRAIADGLQRAGVAATNIIVWDREASKMTSAGYTLNTGTGVQVVAVVPDGSWDEMVYFQNNLAGKLIWGDLQFGKDDEQLSNRSHLPKVLTQRVTKFINVPVLQDHEACGIAGCLYNVSLAMVDNTRRFETLGRRGDPMIAEIATMPMIKDKLVLNVMDGLIGGFAGGPSFKPQYSWHYAGLLFSRDPVAIDALALEMIEARRRENKIPAIGDAAAHVATAAKTGLGQNDRQHIDLVEIKP